MTQRKAALPPLEAGRRPAGIWQLHLYVAGRTGKSLVAYANLKALCDSRMKGCYRITVIDIAEQPQVAKADQIFVTPVVIRRKPRPIRTVFGNLSDPARVLVGLNMTSGH